MERDLVTVGFVSRTPCPMVSAIYEAWVPPGLGLCSGSPAPSDTAQCTVVLNLGIFFRPFFFPCFALFSCVLNSFCLLGLMGDDAGMYISTLVRSLLTGSGGT